MKMSLLIPRIGNFLVLEMELVNCCVLMYCFSVSG